MTHLRYPEEPLEPSWWRSKERNSIKLCSVHQHSVFCWESRTRGQFKAGSRVNILGYITMTSQWREGVPNHQPYDCLLNSKKTSKFRVTGLCRGNSPEPVNSPHKWPVTRKMFPFDDVVVYLEAWTKRPEKIHCRERKLLHSDPNYTKMWSERSTW